MLIWNATDLHFVLRETRFFVFVPMYHRACPDTLHLLLGLCQIHMQKADVGTLWLVSHVTEIGGISLVICLPEVRSLKEMLLAVRPALLF